MSQENLLPNTHAIQKGVIEEVSYRGKWLVRWKDAHGSVIQRKFETVDESHPFFLECVEKQRALLRADR
jgi:hypothetical protein